MKRILLNSSEKLKYFIKNFQKSDVSSSYEWKSEVPCLLSSRNYYCLLAIVSIDKERQ
jgi:hypothetical protein